MAIYGEALARRKHWPLWMLLARRLLHLEHTCTMAPAGAHRKCTRLGCMVPVMASPFVQSHTHPVYAPPAHECPYSLAGGQGSCQ